MFLILVAKFLGLIDLSLLIVPFAAFLAVVNGCLAASFALAATSCAFVLTVLPKPVFALEAAAVASSIVFNAAFASSLINAFLASNSLIIAKSSALFAPSIFDTLASSFLISATSFATFSLFVAPALTLLKLYFVELTASLPNAEIF